ncbi:MAG: amidohydrolase [Actinomycetota bacterium]|nr:amidohydrolase [Actinomycetota bacterium]
MTRYRADVVLTADESFSTFSPGVVDVQDGRIAWVGPADAAPDGGGAQEHRLHGLLMPGLVNVHCHTPMTLFRGAGEDLPIQQWLEDVLWPREIRITADDTYWGMTLGAAESLTRGVTTTCEMYWYEAATAEAARTAGLRCILTPGLIAVPAWEEKVGTWEQRIEQILELRASVSDDLIEVGFGPHAAYTLPPEALAGVGEAARRHGALVHVHVAESRSEVYGVEKQHGKSVPALMADVGLFGGRVLAAHSVWLSDDDLDIYRQYDVAVAHCPQSNAKLASGIARLADMLAMDLRVGLGTDGPASNNDLDLWEEMRLAVMLARARSHDASLVPSRQAVELVTRRGAAALGRNDIGALEVGRWADMILLHTDDPTFVPLLDLDDVAPLLVWSVSSRLVTDVWVGGRHVVHESRCISVDEAQARTEVQQRAQRLADEAAAGG